MSSIKVECVIKEKTEIGESPVWEEKDSSLLYVDIAGQRVSRWNSLTSQIESIATGKPEDISLVWAAFSLSMNLVNMQPNVYLSHFKSNVFNVFGLHFIQRCIRHWFKWD